MLLIYDFKVDTRVSRLNNDLVHKMSAFKQVSSCSWTTKQARMMIYVFFVKCHGYLMHAYLCHQVIIYLLVSLNAEDDVE